MVPATWSRARLMGALFAAQVCGSAGHSIGMAVGGIMAAEITGTNAWTGLPVALGALGTALASWPLAAFMARAGRRPGLVVGYGLAVVGAGLGMTGVLVRNFLLLLLGIIMGLMGALGSAVGGVVLGTWGFLALNALGALVVVGFLTAVWILRPALAVTGLKRSRAEPTTP